MSFTNGGYADDGCDKSLEDCIPCTCQSSKSLKVILIIVENFYEGC